MAKIADIRKQYPQYDDLSDAQLADSLHGKFYSDIDREDFNRRVGLTDAVEPAEPPRNPAAMTPSERQFPEANIGDYPGPMQVGDRGVPEGEGGSTLDALVKLGQNIPEVFQRQFGGAIQAMGEAAEAKVRSPETAAPATAAMTGSDMLAADALQAEAQGTSIEEARESRRQAAETNPVAEAGERIFSEATQRLRENAPDIEPGTVPYYTYLSGEALLNMGPAALASVATRSPGVGITLMGGQVGSDQYAQARERGLEPEEAAGEAAYYAATEALTERIPLGQLVRAGGNFASRAFKSAVAEGIQEPVTEALQMGYEMGVLDEDVSAREASRRLWDAGVIGFTAGGGLSIVTEPLVRAQRQGEKIGGGERGEAARAEAGDTPLGEEVATGRRRAGGGAQGAPEAPTEDVGHDTANVASKRQRASAGEIPLDEVVPQKRVDEMTPDEMRSALLESDVTGLPNRRAFVEAEKRPGRISADADSLKWVNDNLGHDAGNALLSSVGQAFREQGVEAYHISGDEFVVQADSVEDAEGQMAQVEQRLQGNTLRVTSPDGRILEVTPGLSYGAGQTLTEAEQTLGKQKTARQRAGQRAPRGERPPTVRDVEAEGRGGRDRPVPVEDRGAATPQGVEGMQPGVEAMAPGENYQPMLREAAPAEEPTIALSGERQVSVPSEPIRRRNIIRTIEREFGNRIYTGRIKGKTLLGFHRKPNNEIRTKRTDDLEVTAHELAHWIDDRYPAFAKVYRTPHYANELKAISYDANKVHEGFAEFVRLYMTQEPEARTRAPQFFDKFQQILADTGLTQRVNRIQEDMHAWYYQGAKQRLASKMGASQSVRQRLDAALDRATDRFVTHSLDGLHEIAVAEKDLQGYIADATQSPYKAMRLVAGARGTIKSIYHYGTIGWNAKGDIHFTGKSMEDVFAPISDNLENAKHYFIARRAQELKKQGRENLIEQDEIDAGLREGENDPRLKTAFDDWLAFNKRMMDFYQDSGIVSSESRAAMEDANKDYVPFQRIIETVAGDERTRTGAFQRLRGGTQNLGDIFENMEQSVATLTRMALINRAKQLAYDMVDKSRGGSYYAVKVPKETKPVEVSEEDLIAKIVPGFGITPAQFRKYRKDGQIPTGVRSQTMEAVELMISRMAAMDQFTTFFQHGQAPQGDNIDTVMRNGETQYYEIGDPLWLIAMSHFGPKNVNMALRIAGGFSNVLRRSVTSMPSFLIPNLVRDGTNAIMFSRGGWKGRTPFAGAIGGWSDAIRRDEKYWQFMANGGGFSSTVHGEVEQSVQRFYEREGINYNSVLDTPRKFLDNWDTITSAFEYGTRLGEFRQVQGQGRSAREAAISGREISTDFSMHGASQALSAIRMSVPFFNTRLQGMYKIVREAGATKERNGSMTGMASALAMRGVSLLTVPALALWAWNNMDDERREKYQSLPNWVRDMHWVVYVPGREAPFLIPKPFEVGAIFATVPERMADAMTQGDGEDLGPALYWILAEQLNLAPMPQVFNPVYEDMTNENFMGMPVLPPDLQDVDPVEQFKPWTSDTAIAIGKKLGVSPTKVEHYLRGYFGTLGAQALAVSDMALHDEERYGERPEMELTDYPVVRRFTGKNPQTGTKQQREWYDFMGAVREAKSTVDKIISEGRNPQTYLEGEEETERLYGISQSPGYRGLSNAINEIQRAMEQVRTSKDMSGEQKRAEMDRLQGQLNEVYRQGATLADDINSRGQ